MGYASYVDCRLGNETSQKKFCLVLLIPNRRTRKIEYCVYGRPTAASFSRNSELSRARGLNTKASLSRFWYTFYEEFLQIPNDDEQGHTQNRFNYCILRGTWGPIISNVVETSSKLYVDQFVSHPIFHSFLLSIHKFIFSILKTRVDMSGIVKEAAGVFRRQVPRGAINWSRSIPSINVSLKVSFRFFFWRYLPPMRFPIDRKFEMGEHPTSNVPKA